MHATTVASCEKQEEQSGRHHDDASSASPCHGSPQSATSLHSLELEKERERV
jgi:hypothetical protein